MIRVGWSTREVPLAPAGVVGSGTVARALGERVLDGAETWSGVVGSGLMVVMGEALPWVDGVRYVGQHPQASGLFHDTRLAPDLPASWLVARFGSPIVLLPELVIPLAELAPLHSPAIRAWLESW